MALLVVLLAQVVIAPFGASPGVRAAVALTLMTPLALRELGVLHFRLPQNARLVPETVFRFGIGLGAFQFGVEMGSGVRTYVTSALPYMLILAVVADHGVTHALLAGFGFAAGRAIMAVAGTRHRDVTGWHRAFLLSRVVRIGLLAGFIALYLLLAAVHPLAEAL